MILALLEMKSKVTGLIMDERASEHYRAIECEGEIVMDLGCGRWGMTKLEDTSPGYFMAQGAEKIIGVDKSNADVACYSENLAGVWIQENLLLTEQIRSLISIHKPTLLKVDIEGDEILLTCLGEDDMEGIRKMAIEYHSEELEEMIQEWAEAIGFSQRENHRFSYGRGTKGVLYMDR